LPTEHEEPTPQLAPGIGFVLEGDGRLTKRCTKCGVELFASIQYFNKYKRGKYGLDPRCKLCKSKIFKEWRTGKNKIRLNEYSRLKQKEIKDFIDKLKDKPCNDCGGEYPSWMMEFDHLKNKTITIAKIRKQKWSKFRILEELHYCELVCVGCHRLRTLERSPEIKFDLSTRYGRNRAEIIAFLAKIKDNNCSDCGKKFHSCQMDFDHRPNEIKRYNISRMVGRGYCLSMIEKELAKCELVCAWCHRIRTYIRKDYVKWMKQN